MFITEDHIVKIPEKLVADPWIPVLYTVTEKIHENQNLCTLILEPEGETSIAAMKPGQFNMLYVFGVGEIPISVSRLSEAHPRLTHTIASVGAVSRACCALESGESIGVRGPFGSSWPTSEATSKDILIMAGGVGIAPLRPLIEHILSHRDVYGKVNILYGTRDPGMILFHQDIISLQSDESVNFLITVDHSYTTWRGNVGVVTTLVDKAVFNPENTIAYICGPEIMMRYGAYTLLNAGIPEHHIYLSLERNMKCGIGHCGHCQYGSFFVCKDGPVFNYPAVKDYLNIHEL